MANSSIQRKITDPEYTTQSVNYTANFHWGGSWSVQNVVSTAGVVSVTINGNSASISSVVLNIALSGYTPVGITYTPATDMDGGLAIIKKSSSDSGASRCALTLSGDTITATPSSAVALLGGNAYFKLPSSLTVKYIKNN